MTLMQMFIGEASTLNGLYLCQGQPRGPWHGPESPLPHNYVVRVMNVKSSPAVGEGASRTSYSLVCDRELAAFLAV